MRKEILSFRNSWFCSIAHCQKVGFRRGIHLSGGTSKKERSLGLVRAICAGIGFRGTRKKGGRHLLSFAVIWAAKVQNETSRLASFSICLKLRQRTFG